MAGESVASLLAGLTGSSGETPTAVYAKWASLSSGDDASLEQLVRRKLIANGHGANLGESLEATVRKGGGVGASAEEMLRNTGLTGWS